MIRRSFLKQSTFAALGLTFGHTACAFQHKKDTEVLILGAGLAGLYTAMLLQEKGISYKILEGSNRVGGRLFTKRNLKSPIELGGVEIGDGYKRVLEVAKQVNIELIKPKPYPKSWMIHYKGENIVSDDWATSLMNPLSQDLKKLTPYRLESAALREKMPLQNTSDWYQKGYEKLDKPYRHFLEEATYDEEAIRLANLAANHNGLDKISTLHVMRSMAYRMMGGSKAVLNVAGGSDTLPNAMAKSLDSTVELNKQVEKIIEEKNRIQVQCQDGTSYTADKLICTIPFSVLKDVELAIGFTEIQKQAIQQLPYTNIAIAIVAVKNKFWKTDGLPLSMWTDSPIERVFAANDKEAEQVYLKVFINGKGARIANEDSFKNRVEKTLHQIRPSTQNNIEVIDTFSWSNYKYNKGAYAEFHAGQVTKFVPEMARPTKRVFLAGEHLSFAEKGMEGALASANNAVNQLFN